jgi:acyl-CoA thioesterase I
MALKAVSADGALMDRQYVLWVLALASNSTTEGIIADVAKQERVGLFSRFGLMRNSINAGVAQSAHVAWNGLHNTADGYNRIGRSLASQQASVERSSSAKSNAAPSREFGLGQRC